MALNPVSSSPSSPATGRSMRAWKLPAATERTPRSSSFTGRVMVRALNTAPRITSTQMEMNTATVTSRVRAALARAVSLGFTPSPSTP